MSKHFLAGRCFRDEAPNDPAYSDFARLAGTDFDCVDFAYLKSLVEVGRESNAWIILAGHDVGENKRQTVGAAVFDQFCRYCQDPANGVWIDTVDTVARHVSKTRRPVAI